MFKIIREDDVVYFCNAVGEVFCWDFHTKDGKPDLSLENPYSSAGLVTVDIDSERIPEALRRAYEAAWSAGYGFPCYIALVDGVPCLLLIAEFGDLPDDGKRSTELREESVAFARRLEQDLRESKEVVRTVDVLFPEDVRSPFCQWEVTIAVPVEAGKVTVKEMCAISKVALHCLDGCDTPNANVKPAGCCPTCDKEVPDIVKRTIWIKPSSFSPEFEMIIPIPTDRDDEEYIDELLDGILSAEFRYNAEWNFVDGLS